MQPLVVDETDVGSSAGGTNWARVSLGSYWNEGHAINPAIWLAIVQCGWQGYESTLPFWRQVLQARRILGLVWQRTFKTLVLPKKMPATKLAKVQTGVLL